MKYLIRIWASLFIAAMISTLASAETETKKSKYNTEVYEKEDRQSKISDIVKVIREIDGGTEVVFSKVGTYTAPTDEAAMERLQESLKSKLPVSVTFNEDSRKILKVGAPQKPPEKPTVPAVPAPNR